MKVQQLMTKDVRYCRADDTLAVAARILWDGDCGFVPVVADDSSRELVGVITDRDICMAAYTQGKTLGELSVGVAMATEVAACRPDETIAAAQKRMRQAGVRRLPVLDESGGLVGVLSLADLARQAAAESGKTRPRVSEKQVGQTLGEICQQREVAAQET